MVHCGCDFGCFGKCAGYLPSLRLFVCRLEMGNPDGRGKKEAGRGEATSGRGTGQEGAPSKTGKGEEAEKEGKRRIHTGGQGNGGGADEEGEEGQEGTGQAPSA